MSATTPSAHERIAELCGTIGLVVKGKQQAIELAVVALLAEGHLLIEDVPGVGKTTLGQTLATALGSTFHRLQFTSDLLPSDVLGVSVYNPERHAFEFKPGPIFANIVLADEINRTTPKTQSALLEAMNEHQVTIDNVTHPLPRPFMVLATQNPVEHHGTYPLPESQLDRFLMRIEMGYPDAAAEREILRQFTEGRRGPAPHVVLDIEAVLALQRESRRVHVRDALVDYMIAIVNQTRRHPEVALGVSPRGTGALFRACQSLALLHGRDYVLPDDIKRLVVPVFSHRLVLARNSGRARPDPAGILREILQAVGVPV